MDILKRNSKQYDWKTSNKKMDISMLKIFMRN